MDDNATDTDEAFQPSKENPRDGLIDFAAYAIERLRDLQYSIDPESFPENYKNP
jgi:hypothetical protein